MLALSPEAAKEIEMRFKKAHILPIARVAHNWPEAEHRLLADQDHARIENLHFAH